MKLTSGAIGCLLPLSLCSLMFAGSAPSPQPPRSLEGMTDRYLTEIVEAQWKKRAEALGAIRTPEDVHARKEYIREKMMQAIGGEFPEKTPLNARIAGTLERDGYRIEKLIFESLPNFYVTANVYVPASGQPPWPAVLGTAGHSGDGKTADLYQRVWISLARRGFVVLAYDPPGQGERSQYIDPATGESLVPGLNIGGGPSEHIMAGLQCLLTGTNVARYFIWDGIRAFDYLLTRDDVDPLRIGVAGNSGGGTQSSYLAAFEPRLAAAAPSCYLTSWEKLWGGTDSRLGPQDAEQVFVNFLKDGLGFSDFLIAFAPKPLQMTVATRDYFPIEGAKITHAEALRIYDILGKPECLGFFESDNPHGWHQEPREATYRWFARWLQDREDDGAEPEFETEKPQTLWCCETGQVATSLPGARSIQSFNQALAEELYAKRSGAGGRNIPDLVRARLGVDIERGAAEAAGNAAGLSSAIEEREGYRIERVELRPEPGIVVPALLFLPAGGAARKSAVLYVNPAGKEADAAEGGPLGAIARAGHIALAPDLRGWGESAYPIARRSYGKSNPNYQTVMRALLAGKNMVGMRVGDLLHAFDYLIARPDVDQARIAIVGKDNAASLGLLAAALEPGIAKIACAPLPPSYMDIVRKQGHSGIDEVVVPGVLKDFDLPDVIDALKPRMVWNVEKEDPDYAAWLAR